MAVLFAPGDGRVAIGLEDIAYLIDILDIKHDDTRHFEGDLALFVRRLLCTAPLTVTEDRESSGGPPLTAKQKTDSLHQNCIFCLLFATTACKRTGITPYHLPHWTSSLVQQYPIISAPPHVYAQLFGVRR